MKQLVTFLVLGVLVATPSLSLAEATAKSKPAVRKHQRVTKRGATVTKRVTNGDLKTDVSFDDSVLHGEYQTPDEALAKVENEKTFGDLVGVRKHFKDRLTQAAEQE